MNSTELKLIEVQHPGRTRTCAHARARLRIAEEKRDAAKLKAFAETAPTVELKVMLIDQAIDCLRRAQELMLATENQ